MIYHSSCLTDPITKTIYMHICIEVDASIYMHPLHTRLQAKNEFLFIHFHLTKCHLLH